MSEDAKARLKSLGGGMREWAAEKAKAAGKSALEHVKPYKCLGCGELCAGNAAECPTCLTPRGMAAPVQKQLIRMYDKGDIDKEFRLDAGKLARAGWRVQSQSYGGQKRLGLPSAMAFGLASGRKPNEMTVIYSHE
ncbi:MAG: hypothetical protein ACHQ4H_07160 [Ktedonobacterales bacterium]